MNAAIAVAAGWIAFFPLVVALSVGSAAAPVTDYGNSGGTGDRSGSITVTTNITPSSGTVAKLVNGSTTADATNAFKMGASTDKLKYIQFDFGTSKCINAFKWYTDASNSHGDWIWSATNDQITYTELKTCTMAGGAPGATEFTYTNTKGYRYYILWQKPGSLPSTTPWNTEIEFKIAAASAYSPPTTIASYTWKYGFLDRSAFITPTTTSTTGGGTLSNLVDGDAADNASDSWWFGGGQTGREVVFDFGTAVKLNEVTFMQDLSTNQGSWQAAYSDDNASYTNFGAAFTWGGAANSTGDLSAMPSAHRYVKFTQQSGTTSSSPFQREILFKGSMT